MEKIFIVQYSSKAIVVAGDTKPIKEILRLAGGKFNARLHHPITGGRLIGWIFSRTRQAQIETLLAGNGIRFSSEIPSNINDRNAQDYIPDPAEIASDQWCRTNNI